MEEFLGVVEDPSLSSSAEVSTDADRLKFFNSKVKVWEYAKILASDFQKFSFDNRSSILKNYYLDMSTKYSTGAGKMFYILILICFWLASELLLTYF